MSGFLRDSGSMVQHPISSPVPALSVVILAGGQSRRLGRDKAFLELDGEPLLARVVRRLAELTDDLVVVTNAPDRYELLALPVRFVPDEESGVGPLMGIYSGLQVTCHAHALVVACDMPFLNLPLLRYMSPLIAGHDAVVPRLGDMLEPLHAIYGKSCLPFMAQLLARHERQIIAFFRQVRIRYVDREEIDRFDPDHLTFMNVNSPADWRRVKESLTRRRR